MSRLQSEWRRLYLPPTSEGTDGGPGSAGLVDTQGQVRAMVLTLSRPADWDALATVWRGVQLDLSLPAPAIAVSGVDGYQLWFSLAAPLPVARAAAFLEALRVRYLTGIGPERIGMLPAMDEAKPLQVRHAALVPSPQGDAPASEADDDRRWSAFVAPDLAPVFAETPWLDFPPSELGQAELLSQLDVIPLPDFERAEAQLQAGQQAGLAVDLTAQQRQADRAIDAHVPAQATLDPQRFLLKVMNDDTVDMALRIEAAKALLPFCCAAPASSSSR